jgi:hypothetical protein
MNLEKMKESQRKCRERAQQRQREKYFKVNLNLQHIRISNRKLNCLRWGSNETKEHILKKLEICIELKELEHEFITEAIFNNGGRADVIDLTSGIIYEILCSEDEIKFEEKIKKYPEEFEVVKILTKYENN